ncbi:MAG: hypothetical protein PWR01_2141 [Clostridiales bacterium]|nr:hypothetical protein [Clostridiales bacterium]MDN5281068.1 hypothetical protein [Candidatus Ozemobacter sp.]
MIILRIAYRNLWRNKRRTQLTMIAMVFACSLLVFSLGYYDGILWNLINNATEKENGHITIARPGYVDAPSINSNFLPEAFFDEIGKEPINNIKGYCSRVTTFALLSSGPESKSQTQPSEIMGIDPVAESKLSKLADCVVEGSFIKGNEREIVLGRGLARRLKAKPGDEIILVSNGADGSIASEILILAGIIDTGEELRDSSLAIMNIREVQQLFVLGENVHSLRIFLEDPLSAKEVAKRLQKRTKSFEVTPWHSIFPQISSVLGIWFGMQLFTMAIYYAALAMITFNTMYMAFLERMHEFGVMRAIGLSRLKLSLLILFESFIIAGISGLIGITIGTAANYLLYYHPIDLSHWFDNLSWGGSFIKIQLFCVPGWSTTMMPFLAILVLGILVAAFPAFRLLRLKPVEALREA